MGTVTVAAATPASNATCWRHGAAPTSWPVFKSCRLLLELQATANRIAVMKSAIATRGFAAMAGEKTAPGTSAVPTTARMPTPEMGLLEEPIRPAM